MLGCMTNYAHRIQKHDYVSMCLNKLKYTMKNWNPITTEQQVKDIVEKSNEKTQIIFKDSVTCGISAYAKERLVNGNDVLIDKADFNYLDLLSYRSVSNFIADELNVIHQSPQIIVLKDGEVVYRVSHHSIQAEEIAKYL
jgi:bacillithiol system protein YtxJ